MARVRLELWGWGFMCARGAAAAGRRGRARGPTRDASGRCWRRGIGCSSEHDNPIDATPQVGRRNGAGDGIIAPPTRRTTTHSRVGFRYRYRFRSGRRTPAVAAPRRFRAARRVHRHRRVGRGAPRAGRQLGPAELPLLHRLGLVERAPRVHDWTSRPPSCRPTTTRCSTCRSS